MRRVVAASLGLILLLTACQAARPTPQQAKRVAGARTRLGDVYDNNYYVGGAPPRGRGACTEVVVAAMQAIGIDLQRAVAEDVHHGRYPLVRDRNIDYRWCPNLVVWFSRHRRTCSTAGDWQPGDVVFWTWSADQVADHCGVVSDTSNPAGLPLVIHNTGPVCVEEDALLRWTVVGHFR